ncbi:hypothetical protein TRVA0_001S01200 [Trichomonascus vanleenenianus]|uniref:uncharacterized protein n=1 Tax=Trichomonascus vanleenenianus TaxID=2268995 RepID=UPI003EC977DE
MSNSGGKHVAVNSFNSADVSKFLSKAYAEAVAHGQTYKPRLAGWSSSKTSTQPIASKTNGLLNDMYKSAFKSHSSNSNGNNGSHRRKR